MPGKGNGIPYFYLTSLDPTTRNALKDARASFAVSESPIGTCKRDPMDPTCSKLTLTGKVNNCLQKTELFLSTCLQQANAPVFYLIMSQLLQLDEGSEEEEVAKKALFTKHPEMMGK